MYLYETHVHTAPLSACAKAGIRETLEYYKSAGYAGIFMTDHFIDGNINHSVRNLSYEERIRAYFSAYEEAKSVGEELGLEVFSGIEMTYLGTDFLVYGIDKKWCLEHRDMDRIKKSELLSILGEEGALIIHAHPFRDASYIDHIRLYPKQVHGVEVYNAGRTDFENKLASQYCENYGLLRFAGTDNHLAGMQKRFGGMATERPIWDVEDFINMVLSGEAKPFVRDEGGVEFI